MTSRRHFSAAWPSVTAPQLVWRFFTWIFPSHSGPWQLTWMTGMWKKERNSGVWKGAAKGDGCGCWFCEVVTMGCINWGDVYWKWDWQTGAKGRKRSWRACCVRRWRWRREEERKALAIRLIQVPHWAALRLTKLSVFTLRRLERTHVNIVMMRRWTYTADATLWLD